MIVRPFNPSDLDQIDQIWKEHWRNESSILDRKNAIVDRVVEDSGRIIAYGQVHHFAEAMAFPDMNCSLRERILALKLLLTEAFIGVDKAGLKELYIFSRQPEFANILSKHFGFEIVDNPGELLLREV